jgi:uncharacterized protein (TIGR02246 family)
MMRDRERGQLSKPAVWGCLVVLLWTTACKQPPPVDTPEADEQAIRNLDAKWEKTAEARDLDGALSYYSDDAVVMPGNAPIVQGKEAIRTLWKSLLSPDISLSWQATKVDVARSGELAYLIGTYTLTAKDAQGKPATDHGKLLEIFKKKGDGPWKVAVDMYNSDLPAPPA